MLFLSVDWRRPTWNTWIDYGLAYAKEKYPNLKLVTERIPYR